MQVTVRFFAGASAAAGVEEESVALPGGATLRTLSDVLVDRHGRALAAVLAASSYIVDEIALSLAAGQDRALPDGALIDVLPPFAGG